MRERKFVFERVTTLPTYVHGGDIQTYIDRHGFAPLDLSANINPFGIPDAVRAAMHRAVDNCTQYPDPFCRAARQAIGAREGVNPDFLYCGNGAADVLDRLAAVLKPRKVLLIAPTLRSTSARSQVRRFGCIICGKQTVLRSQNVFWTRFHRIWMRFISAIRNIRPGEPHNRSSCGKSFGNVQKTA